MQQSLPDRPVKNVRNVLTVVTLSALIVCCFLIAYSVRWMILGAGIGIGLGALLVPVVRSLKRFKVPTAIAGVMTLLLVLGTIGGFFYLIGTLIVQELGGNVQQITDALAGVQKSFAELLRDQPWLQKRVQGADLGQLVQDFLSGVMSTLQISFTVFAGILVAVALGMYVAIDPKR